MKTLSKFFKEEIMKSFNKSNSRHSLALLLSLIIHVFVFGYLYKNIHSDQSTLATVYKKKPGSLNTVKLDSVKFITQKQLKEIKAAHSQVVANELNGKKERPANSRFLGEKDQVFDRQTISATNGAFKKAGLGAKDANGLVKNQPKSLETSKDKIVKNEKIKNNFKSLSLSDFGMVKIEENENSQEKITATKNINSSKSNKNSMAQGVAQGSSDEVGFSSNSDFVEEVPLGDMTNLNTTEFKYYGFYHRIRQKLEQHWGNSIQNKAKNLYKSGRKIPASENLITAITVILDDHGQIVDIKIEGTSGIRELDQAAVESFNKAGPFPNPPKGLLVDGRAVIQWGFVVKS